MNVITAMYGRPHVGGAAGKDCWCGPDVEQDGDTLMITHCPIDRRPDTQPRMAIFSDQMFADNGPRYGTTFT